MRAPHGVFRVSPGLVGASLLVLMGVSGCLPPAVRWLPDSSGVVFSSAEGERQVHYDLNANKRNVIVRESGMKTICPGLSRDGKRVAVAHVEKLARRGSSRESTQVQVQIYDLGGRLLQTSRLFERVAERGEPAKKTQVTVEPVSLDWSGPANKVLLSVGIYDCERDTFIDLPSELTPLFFLQPVRPDGAGFLAFHEEDIVFVDWEGRAQTIEADKKVAEEDDQAGEFLGMDWDRHVARLRFQGEVFLIDTEARKATIQRVARPSSNDKEEAVFTYEFPEGKSRLRVVERGGSGWFRSKHHDLDALDPETQHWHTLLTRVDASLLASNFQPAPDGKKVAFATAAKGHGNIVAFIDDTGTLVAALPREGNSPARRPASSEGPRPKRPCACCKDGAHVK